MTQLDTVRYADSAADEGPTSQRRKALLWCPNCGHESRVDGDWIIVLHETTADLSCPDCRTRITRRRLTE